MHTHTGPSAHNVYVPTPTPRGPKHTTHPHTCRRQAVPVLDARTRERQTLFNIMAKLPFGCDGFFALKRLAMHVDYARTRVHTRTRQPARKTPSRSLRTNVVVRLGVVATINVVFQNRRTPAQRAGGFCMRAPMKLNSPRLLFGDAIHTQAPSKPAPAAAAVRPDS